MKSSKYRTSFRVLWKRGTFNGIDTCSITTFGEFIFTSKLSSEITSRSICYHPEISSIMSGLFKKSSSYGVNSLYQEAKIIGNSINFYRFVQGDTYVHIHIVI